MRSQQFLYNHWLGLRAQCHHRCNLVHRTSTPQETFWFLWDANSDKTAVFDVLGMRMVWKLIPAHTFVLAGYSARERWWEFNKQRDKRDKLGWSPSKSQQCGAWRQWATCRWSDDCMKSWNKKGNNSRWLQRGRKIFGTAPFRQNANTSYRGWPQSSAAHLQTIGTQPNRSLGSYHQPSD